MNADQFRQLCIDARDRQDSILFKKGIEYTQGADDRGANFKRIAERLGVDPLVIWYVYFQKHVDAVASYVKFGKVQSEEPIEGRFDDCMNYLLLGLLLVHDEKKGVSPSIPVVTSPKPKPVLEPVRERPASYVPLPGPDDRYHCRVCPNTSYSREQVHDAIRHEQETCHCVVINTLSRFLRPRGEVYQP